MNPLSSFHSTPALLLILISLVPLSARARALLGNLIAAEDLELDAALASPIDLKQMLNDTKQIRFPPVAQPPFESAVKSTKAASCPTKQIYNMNLLRHPTNFMETTCEQSESSDGLHQCVTLYAGVFVVASSYEFSSLKSMTSSEEKNMIGIGCYPLPKFH